MKVVICPVCKGRCKVRADFYEINSVKLNPCPVTCKSCNGKGYIVIPEDHSPNDVTVQCGSCATCGLNDGAIYTSNPPCYRCTLDNQFHFSDYCCDKYKAKSTSLM